MIHDTEEMVRDYIECLQDESGIKFIEKYLYTFDATRGKKMPFMLFPRQRVFLETLAKNRNVVSIKPRQCGITTLTSAWATRKCALADKDAPETILCIGNKLDLAQQLITKIHDFLNQVPRWYWGDEYYSPDPKSEKNQKSIFVKDSKSELELFNGCRVVARSSGENAARGISAVSILILDEAAFIENSKAVYATAAATMASNPSSKTVMVSTPNGHDELYYDTYRQALAGENNFVAVQFRWYQDPRYNKNLKWFKKDEKTGEMKWIIEPTLDKEGSVKYDEEHWEGLIQKGWTPRSPWYEDMCQSFNNDRVKIAQELDVSFAGSSDNVIDPEYIEMHETLNVREPLTDMKDPLVDETWFWKPPIEGHRYICSCLPTGEQVLTQRGLVNVENVQDDDLLVTKEGEFTKIKHRMCREVENEEVVEILPYMAFNSTRFTWNHPIWSSIDTKLKRNDVRGRYWDFKFCKNNANLLKKGDWLAIPNFYKINKINVDEIKKYCRYNLESNVLLNKDFWWYCGLWVAEGSLTNHDNTIITTHNSNENKIIHRAEMVATTIFNANASICKIKNENCTQIRFTSSALKKFLIDTFSFGSKNKHVSEWVKMLPSEYVIEFLRGYFDGDGCLNKFNIIEFVSISLNLLKDVRDMLLSIGIISSIKQCTKEHFGLVIGRMCHLNDKYDLTLSKGNTNLLCEKIGIDYLSKSKNRRAISYSFFNDDETILFLRIKDIKVQKYSGRVYNFETESNSHSYMCNYIGVGNCDPSRGSSDDNTAIEVIDMDGKDENGFPIVEQVMEYYGKKLGDEIGEILYNYAVLYNNAYVVIDCTNGLGDVPLFVLINKGYKNLFYDDSTLKKYTVQVSTQQPSKDYTDVMPGFHMQGNRYPVLANFANMVRNNEFKIRSNRVITELNSWIFKGEAKRMDHQDGQHDDAITCLAMGLFVMLFSYKKLESAQNKDKAILGAYMMGNSISLNKKHLSNDSPITPKSGLPFYDNKLLKKIDGINGNFMWLFANYGK